MEYRSLEHKIRDLWISEANRNTEMRRKVANVGRPENNVKDETSKLGKQGEIKTKIIDEAADDDPGNLVSDKKTKKDTDMNDMDAKTIKGGKTEVDTEPKTDDRTENSTDEDSKSKKTRNQENKKIGAKGVKEETMTGKLTLGSTQSQINAIAEAMKTMKGICPKCKKAKCMCESMKEENIDEKLVGKQHKIDANHNGRIDAQDFKILKGKKKVEEEVEELDERDAGNKVKKDAAVAGVGAKNRDDQHLGSRGMKTSVADKIRGREKMSGVDRKQYKEEVEFSEAEIARIEEIAASIDEVVTKRNLTAADKAAKAKYIASHQARLAAHDTGVEPPKKSFKDVNTERGDYTSQPSKMGLRHAIGAGYYKND